MKGWITFETLYEYRGGGFDTSTGIYEVPKDGFYIFGLRASSGAEQSEEGEELYWTEINFYKNNEVYGTVVYDGNVKDHHNNLGTTWVEDLKKGDVIRLKVEEGTVAGYLFWWGFRIFEL